jgi:predicted Zn-dependent peptidase
MGANVNKTVLTNGVRILTQKLPYINSVAMGVWINAGARDESSEENGLSHLIEHMIFKGTQKRSAYQIAKEFDAIGGQTNAFTSSENICFHAKVLDTHLPQMVDILSDILMNSAFDPEEISRERPVILQEIGMVEDSPDEYVHVLGSRKFWGNHPLGRSILGTKDNILKFDDSIIRRFFSRFYQPERIIITAAGNLDHDHFIDLAEREFERVTTGTLLPERTAPTIHPGLEIYYRDLEQVHLCLMSGGISITDPRRYAFSLMNTIVGGNMSSRLFQEIREQRGLAYVVYSFLTSYVDTGAFGVYAGVSPDNINLTIELILKELRRLKHEPVGAAELEEAKEYTKGNLLLSTESNENQMVRLAQSEIHFGSYTPMGEILERIEKVTPEDILELAAIIFKPEQLALTVLGPMKDSDFLEKQLNL